MTLVGVKRELSGPDVSHSLDSDSMRVVDTHRRKRAIG